MIEHQDVYSYITAEKTNWRTTRVPLTNSKDWSMYEHIERCKNVANGWFHKGVNDGLRPYNDIVTPIIDVAFRSEGFDVKDIVPFVNSASEYYKSFLVKKYHPQWARRNELDTFIDEVVENSVIYDLALIKDIKQSRPEAVDLSTIAFCNQIDIMAGPICIQHDFSISEIVAFKGKWNADKIDEAIIQSNESRKIQLANDKTTKLSSKNIEVFELRGNLPKKWRDGEIGAMAEAHEYEDTAYYVTFYNDSEGVKHGITLFEGKDRPLKENFKALKIDQVRSKGRACGKSVVERMFEPQVWNNYAGIKIKDLLDSAINVFQTDSEQFGNQKLSSLKNNTILKHEPGRPITKVDGSLQNIGSLAEYQNKTESSARELGSASDASLGRNPVSGTPFSLESLVVQEGQGIHDYRQGKIATFFSDVLYPDLILKYVVADMNKGQSFSEELTLDELTEISTVVAKNEAEKEVMELILDGQVPTPETRDLLIEMKTKDFMDGGSRRFMEIMKDELEDIPVDVFVNIKGKQKRMAENADKITNIIREIIANPQAFSQIPGIGKAFNELLEDSGMSPIDFSQITATGAFDTPEEQLPQETPQETPQEQPVALPEEVIPVTQ